MVVWDEVHEGGWWCGGVHGSGWLRWLHEGIGFGGWRLDFSRGWVAVWEGVAVWGVWGCMRVGGFAELRQARTATAMLAPAMCFSLTAAATTRIGPLPQVWCPVCARVH